MIVIDASVWVGAFLSRDEHHQKVALFLRQLVEDGISVSTPVLAMPEIAGALAGQTGNPETAQRTIDFLRAQSWIDFAPLTDELAFEAAHIASKHRLRGADAVYVALAARNNAILVTLDAKMLNRTEGVATSVTPSLRLDGYRSGTKGS